MATIEEKPTPVLIREAVARGEAYRDHLRQMRREFDAAAADREAAHSKLVNGGVGPVSSKEVETLQKSRWAVLTDNESGLRKLLTEAENVRDNREEEYAESQRLLAEYHEGLMARFITDFGFSPSTARAKADSDNELIMLRQIAFEIQRQSTTVKQMIRELEESLRGTAEAKVKLSRQWRSI